MQEKKFVPSSSTRALVNVPVNVPYHLINVPKNKLSHQEGEGSIILLVDTHQAEPENTQESGPAPITPSPTHTARTATAAPHLRAPPWVPHVNATVRVQPLCMRKWVLIPPTS